MFQLTGKVAIITGGGSGIGQAIAGLFASRGASVHVLEKNTALAEQTCQLITDRGERAFAHTCDVTDLREVQQVVDAVQSREGRIDILVCSAGIAHIGKLTTTGEADFDRLFQVNVKGVYHAMQACVTHMQQQHRGVVLNIASIASSVGLADRFAYSMTKGAVLSMTLSVAKDYLGDNIRCNCISPARVHTSFVDGFLKQNYPGREQEMFEKLSRTQPIGRMGTPKEVAALALYLCSDESSFVTGCDYPIDGGFLKLNT